MDEDEDEREDPRHILRSFLEAHPLYSACRFEAPDRRFGLNEASYWPGAITLACKRCQREATWKRFDGIKQGRRAAEDAPFDFYPRSFVLRYTCASCEKVDAGFWCSVETEGTTYCVRKLGQSPAWSIAEGIKQALPTAALDSYRNEPLDLLRELSRGAISCAAQSGGPAVPTLSTECGGSAIRATRISTSCGRCSPHRDASATPG